MVPSNELFLFPFELVERDLRVGVTATDDTLQHGESSIGVLLRLLLFEAVGPKIDTVGLGERIDQFMHRFLVEGRGHARAVDTLHCVEEMIHSFGFLCFSVLVVLLSESSWESRCGHN
jgi:hypothetical protein